MKTKIKIINQAYFKILLGLLSLLLIYNVLSFMQAMSYIGVLPILFQSGLLFLLLTKNKYSQIVIKYVVGFTLILLQLIKLSTTLAIAIINNFRNRENPFEELLSEYCLFSLAMLLFGIFILILNKGFAKKEIS